MAMPKCSMPEILDPSSHLLAVTTVLDHSPDSHIDQLQRAAIGPVNADYYRPILVRFETYDRGSPSWNWAACLCTLNWMVFRGMWLPALAYLGGLMLAIATLFAATRLAAPMASSVEWGLWAALATLAFLAPGFFGNTWLFGHYRLRLARALNATPTVVDACQLLGRQASSRRRLILLVAANAVLALSVAALWLWPRPTGHASARVGHGQVHVETLPPATPASQAGSAPTDNPAPQVPTSAPSGSAGGSGSTVMSAAFENLAALQSAPGRGSSIPAGTADVSLRAAATASAPITSAPLPATLPAPPAPPPAPAPVPVPVPATAPLVAANAAPSASAVAPDSPASSLGTASPRATSPARMQAAADAGIRHAAIAARSRGAHMERTAPVASATAPSSPLAAPPSTPAPVRNTVKAPTPVGRYLINVGLFAQKDNARGALDRLRAAGLPATSHELQRGDNTLTRVRVGPFATRSQADAAAQKIRALQLDAVVTRP